MGSDARKTYASVVSCSYLEANDDAKRNEIKIDPETWARRLCAKCHAKTDTKAKHSGHNSKKGTTLKLPSGNEDPMEGEDFPKLTPEEEWTGDPTSEVEFKRKHQRPKGATKPSTANGWRRSRKSGSLSNKNVGNP